jgi:hypothetical protein
MEAEIISPTELATLNDSLRKSIPNLPYPHMLMLTDEVASLPVDKLSELLAMVKGFDNFSEHNDPHCEHDFGKIEFSNETYLFKFDYFDEDLKYYKPGARHVLTILAASEY